MTNQQTSTYKAALKEARAAFDKAMNRLSQITSEEYELTREVGSLRRTITALAALCSEEPGLDPMGITEACTEVMQEMLFEVTTADVVGYLSARGFDVASQKNAPASVHAVLSRLARKGTIKRIDDEENETVKWRGPKYTELSDEDIPF